MRTTRRELCESDLFAKQERVEIHVKSTQYCIEFDISIYEKIHLLIMKITWAFGSIFDCANYQSH